MVLGFSRCLHRLARFVSGLYVCIVRFPHVLSMFLVNLLQKIFNSCIWTFERWIYFFFWARNCKLSGAAFLLNEIVACFDMHTHVPCAIYCSYICFLFSFLVLYVWLQCCLIFCIAFEHCLPDFLGPIPHFCMFWCAYVCLDTTDSFFFCNFPRHILLLPVPQDFWMYYFAKSNSFCGVREFFCVIWLLGLVVVFCCKKQWFASICSCSFWFFPLYLTILRGSIFATCV